MQSADDRVSQMLCDLVADWSAVETQTLDAWVEDMGPSACLLAPLVAGRACSEVHAWLLKHGMVDLMEGQGHNSDKEKHSLDLEALAAPSRRRRKRCAHCPQHAATVIVHTMHASPQLVQRHINVCT